MYETFGEVKPAKEDIVTDVGMCSLDRPGKIKL